MKYAIYFLAVGDSARSCLELSYRTLRQAGFQNDVYILCDKDSVPFVTADNTSVIPLRKEDLNLDENTDSPLAFYDVRRLDKTNSRSARNPVKWTICRAKTLIDMYISFDEYDYIVYLDVDVLTQGPVSDLDEYLKVHKGAIITAQNSNNLRIGGRGNFSLRKMKRVKTFSSANLSLFELFRYWSKPAICSDIVCIPTNSVGRAVMSEWRNECQKNIDYDQPALQAVLLRNYSEKHVLANKNIFGFGPYHNRYLEDKALSEIPSTFVHFGGALKNDEAFTCYYEKFLKK